MIASITESSSECGYRKSHFEFVFYADGCINIGRVRSIAEGTFTCRGIAHRTGRTTDRWLLTARCGFPYSSAIRCV